MEAVAKYRYAHMSAQKVRLVINQIRGLSAVNAINWLTFSNKKAAKLVRKVLQSALANAEHNNNWDLDSLKVTRIFADESVRLRRMQARAKGRGARIFKRFCHITVAVGMGEES